MAKKYIIGVDGGSQSSKVVIFDLEGNLVCEGRQELQPMSLPAPGVAEHPDDDLWDSIVIASQRAMANFVGDVQDIIGVGLCTIRCCRALLKEDGTLASPVISWMDARLARPYEHTDPAVKYVTTTSGYITHRFTGEFNDTTSNYLGEWPIDYDTWQWSADPEIIKKYNVPREMLFSLKLPGAIAGYVTGEASKATGIPLGLPVVATANDKAVEALGAGLSADHTVLISLGTYICSMAIGPQNLTGATNFFTNMASIPHRYLYESGGIRRGMWTVSWIKDLFGDEVSLKAKALGISPEEFLNREATKVPAGSDGLMTVLDWLASPATPYKKGIMIGFDGRHTRAHMYRSVLEAIALTMKNHVDLMCSERQVTLENIIVSGGGSNSDLFMQIFADVFNLPASRNVINGSASVGSAICAAVATGAYDGFSAAIENMVKIRDTFQPNAENAQVYARLNDEAYKTITSCTDEILKKTYPIFG